MVAIRARRTIVVLFVVSVATGAAHPVSAGAPKQTTTLALLQAPRFIADPVATTITGGSPALQAAIRRVLAGIDSSRVRRVKVGTPSKRLPNYATFPPRARWLYIDVMPDRHNRLASGWEVQLLARSVSAIAAARGLSPILGLTANDGSPPGRGEALPRDLYFGMRLPYPAPSGASIRNWTPASLEAAIRALPIRTFSIRSVTVRQPLGLAAVIRARTKGNRWTVAANLNRDLAALDAHSTTSEGTLLEIRDSSGTLVYSAALTTRHPRRGLSYWSWGNSSWWPRTCAPATVHAHVPQGRGQLVGGAYMVDDRPGPDYRQCVTRRYTIAVIDQAGTTVVSRAVTGYHSYAIVLRPGKYQLRSNGWCPFGGHGVVTIAAGKTSKVDTICHFD